MREFLESAGTIVLVILIWSAICAIAAVPYMIGNLIWEWVLA